MTTPTSAAEVRATWTLADLREANIARQTEWCPDQKPDLSFRGNELAGETGEACNVIKKLERERQGWAGSRATTQQLAEELADIIICADLTAMAAGIDLQEAVVAKFNATSAKVGLSTILGPRLLGQQGGDAGEAVKDAERPRLRFCRLCRCAHHDVCVNPRPPKSATDPSSVPQSGEATIVERLADLERDMIEVNPGGCVEARLRAPDPSPVQAGSAAPADLAAVQAERDQAVALLRKLEYGVTVQGHWGCPICDYSGKGRHAPDCGLAAALASSTSVGTGEAS